MAKFKQFELVLANSWGYLLWPARILKVGADAKGGTSYLLFCYGSHSEHHVIKASLASFKDHSDEAAKKTTKGVQKAFEEVETTPEIYKTVSRNFAALNPTHPREITRFCNIRKISCNGTIPCRN